MILSISTNAYQCVTTSMIETGKFPSTIMDTKPEFPPTFTYTNCSFSTFDLARNGIKFIVLYCAKGFPGGSAGKESTCSSGDLGSLPELGRSPREGKGYPLQYSGLENSMDHTVHGIAKSWTWLKWLSPHISVSVEMICGIDSHIHTFTQVGGRKVLWKLKV